MKGPRPRKVPQRTCIACRSVRAKRDLVRIVRTPEGQIVVDPTGKKNGRGAYLCRQRSCWDLGLKRGAIERALKQAVPGESRGALDAYASSLPGELVPSAISADEDESPEGNGGINS